MKWCTLFMCTSLQLFTDWMIWLSVCWSHLSPLNTLRPPVGLVLGLVSWKSWIRLPSSVSAFTTFIFSCWKRTWKVLSDFSTLSPSMLACFIEQWRETATCITVSLLKLVNHQNFYKVLGLKWSLALRTHSELRWQLFSCFFKTSQIMCDATFWVLRQKWWLRSVLDQVARWDGLFAYLTVKPRTDWFLGRQRDGSWERKVEFATMMWSAHLHLAKSLNVPFTVYEPNYHTAK